jgi:hypothetical protein
LSFNGHGESTTVMGSLYASSPGLNAVQGASSLEQLSGSLTSNLGTVGTGAAPLSFALFGSRYDSVGLGFTATFEQTSRLVWHWSARGSRTFPSSSSGPVPVGSITYFDFTEGVGEFGVEYLLSRRTTVGVNLDYTRDDSIFTRMQAPSGAVSLEHQFARDWFIKGEAGVGMLRDPANKASSSWLLGSRGGGGLGTKRGSNTFLLSARRQIGDAYGLGAGNTLAGNFSWRWQRPSGNWTVDNSAGYERISGNSIRLFQGWVYQGDVSRKLSKQTSLSLQGSYAKSLGGLTSATDTYNRSEIRLALNWTPTTVRR